MIVSERSYWLKSGLFSLFEKGSVFLFGFGSFYFLARALDKADFGTWIIFLTLTSFIEVGRAGLLQNALIKFMATCNKEDYGVISTASLVINIALTSLSILLLLSLAKPISSWQNAPVIVPLVQIYALTTLVLVPFNQFNYIQQANLDFKGIFWSNFSKQGLFFCYIAIFYLSNLEITIVNLAILQIFTGLAATFVSYKFARKHLLFSTSIDWQWVKRLLHYGKFVFGTNLSAMIHKTIDKLMLGSMMGQSFAGAYETAIKVTNLAEVPTFSVAAVVFPQGAKKIKTEGRDAIKMLYEKSVGAIFAMILPFMVFVFIFPEFVVTVIASDKWIEAAPVLRITILYGLFLPFAIQFGTVLDAIGLPKINFYFTIFGALMNVVFNYYFISHYGLMGAAYGTLTSYCITFVINQIVLYKLLKIKAINAFFYIPAHYLNAWNISKKRLSGASI